MVKVCTIRHKITERGHCSGDNRDITDLDVTLAEGEARNDTRLEVDSGPTPTSTIITHLEELDAEVAKLKASLRRDHLTVVAAVRSAATAAADDFKIETDRLVLLSAAGRSTPRGLGKRCVQRCIKA